MEASSFDCTLFCRDSDSFIVLRGIVIRFICTPPHTQYLPLNIQVIDLVRRHERQDRTIVGAFADWTGQQLRERAPDIPRIFSAKESLLIYLKYFTGANPS